MTELTVFDQQAESAVFRIKQEALTDIVQICRAHGMELHTAIDIGCGVGLFSGQLVELGLNVTAVDAREQNVEQVRTRYPQVQAEQRSAESPVDDLGKFDLALHYGLLYHLENPLLALRNLRKITGKLAVLETQAPSMGRPMGILRSEPTADDQSTTGMSFRMSREGVLKALFQAGFARVYRYETDSGGQSLFGGSWRRKPRRVLYVMPGVEVGDARLIAESEPRFDMRYDFTLLGRAQDMAARAVRKIGSRF